MLLMGRVSSDMLASSLYLRREIIIFELKGLLGIQISVFFGTMMLLLEHVEWRSCWSAWIG